MSICSLDSLVLKAKNLLLGEENILRVDKVGWQIPPPVFTSGIYRYLPVWKMSPQVANTGKYWQIEFFWS